MEAPRGVVSGAPSAHADQSRPCPRAGSRQRRTPRRVRIRLGRPCAAGFAGARAFGGGGWRRPRAVSGSRFVSALVAIWSSPDQSGRRRAALALSRGDRLADDPRSVFGGVDGPSRGPLGGATTAAASWRPPRPCPDVRPAGRHGRRWRRSRVSSPAGWVVNHLSRTTRPTTPSRRGRLSQPAAPSMTRATRPTAVVEGENHARQLPDRIGRSWSPAAVEQSADGQRRL
jgi:hypothetical protein